MASEELVIHGAREHNLKDIDVRLPRHKLITITGLSGSGKSSLAFDTIYAEGQRRYVESLSSYARQFLQMMEKPDVDSIEGLSPAISIDQKTTSRNPRSTVGTVTEIYDYLRLLYARVGRPHCPVCGRPIAGQSIEAIVDRVLRLEEGTRFTVNAPVVRDRKGEYKDVFEELRADGFTRVRVDGEIRMLEEEIVLDKKFKHTIEVVVDRLIMKPDLRTRLAQSIETALSLADGLVVIDVQDGEELTFSEKFACPEHGVGLPELQPRIFSFNSPHGACPRCTGLGAQQEIDPDLLVPDPTLSIGEGALVPWSTGGSSFYEAVIQGIADKWEIDLDRPWQDLTAEEQDLFLYGTDGERVYIRYRNRMGRKRSYMLAFEGIVKNLERRYRETDSAQQRERIEEYMSFRPCPECGGARLKPEVLAVTVGERNIHEFSKMSVTRSIEFLDALGLTETEQLIGERIIKEIRERLTFLDNVGVGYLQLDRAAATLSGGEAQRLRLATQIGSQLVGVLYILDEPSIGLHQRDNGKLIGTLERLRDLGNTVLVVEHDEQMMRSADYLVDMGPGAGEHGGHVVAEGTAEEVEENKDSVTGQFLSRKRVIAIPDRRSRGPGLVLGARGDAAQPEVDRRRVPGREVRHRHRRVRLGQVHARERDRLQGAREPAAPDAREAGRARELRGDRVLRQGDRHRPVSDRADALGRTRRPTRSSSTTSASSTRSRPRRRCAATSRAGSRSTCAAVAARPARATGRSRSRCTSCRTCTCRARPVMGGATTGRRSRSGSRGSRSRTCSRCRSRRRFASSPRSRSSAGGCRRCTTWGSTTSSSDSPRRRSRAVRRSA